MRTSFRFTLPKGTGIRTEAGRKVTGTMRLIQVKDLVLIERDSQVQRGSGAFYVVLLSKVITELGQEKMITRKTIEGLSSADFAFLVDFMHQVNHQVIKKIPLKCEVCGNEYWGALTELGEA
ncbi:hypothetical protein JFL75_19030 [Breznakiella homolactica]|uniref:Uncharacterized protein n=1 Tax=Breznakiella homolactica TaxID=2798577 RepID=A0A7T7XS09_9SPIR|nr:hypothetical protein JFL75_19030 [Breznakiella homolactica]